MSPNQRTEIESLASHVEELWSHIDELFSVLDAEDGWSGKHGDDWTFADLPYHMAYCDRELVVRFAEQGPDLPSKEQWEARTVNELNAWNAAKFAERPKEQTLAESLRQMHESREIVRHLVSGMTDADLDRPAWFPLIFGRGWSTARMPLGFCRQHTWNEFMQLRIHMERDAPAPSSAITDIAVGGYLSFFPFLLDSAHAHADFAAVMEITQPNVGPWTIQVAGGEATVTQGSAERPDLVITQSPEAFIKTWNQMWDPAEGMRSGEIKVNDLKALGTFGSLFPPLDPDHVF